MSVRKIAFETICNVMINDGYSNLLLRNINLDDQRDQALLNELVYGTLQNFLYLEHQWQRYVDDKLDMKIKCLLNMSIYQLLYLDKIPEYAIVDEAIRIASKIEHGKYKALCNALLRRFINDGENKVAPNDKVEAIALKTSHPYWLVKMWASHYGEETAIAICEHNNFRRPMALRINELKTDRTAIFSDKRFSMGRLADCACYFQGNIFATDYFKNGEILIQDEASQYVSIFAAPNLNDNVLDMCSAPGSKAIHMAELMKLTGHIDALDIHQHRVELINQMIERLAITNIKTHVMDALMVEQQLKQDSYDIVLLDAVCSGLGVCNHKPEIKLFIKPEELDQVVSLQQQLLLQAGVMVKKDGFLIYSTCTLNKKENEKQIERFLIDNNNYVLIKQLTILPMQYDTDGFFMAKLQRIG